MKVYVYPTDYAWFQYLKSRSPLEEVNFWQPGGSSVFRRLDVGDFLIFRLKSPIDMLAGGGVFASSSVVPIGVAWEAFGENNGMPDYRTFQRAIAKYKGHSPPQSLPYDSPIGCIMLSAPIFLDKMFWRPTPSDYHPNLVQGRAYDASSETGKSLLGWISETFERTRTAIVGERREIDVLWSQPTLTRRRLGQGTFRLVVTDNFGRRCAITGERTLPILEAAHVRPVTEGGSHSADNGVLLRRDIHRLFDLGYVGITPEYQFTVSQQLQRSWQNGRIYYALQGQKLRLPANREDWPSPQALEWHMESVFQR